MIKKSFLSLNLIIFVLSLLNFGCTQKNVDLIPIRFNKDENFERSNLYNINELFTEMEAPGTKADDYYFVVIGDTRNLVRSYKLNPFNFLAKQILFAKDKNSGERIYDKIKFIIHMGDLVYNGNERMHWLNLQKGFSEKDYPYDNYPYIKLFAESKPIFPVLGNHDIMRFRLKSQTRYKGTADSNKGLNFFKKFFNWEEFIANPNILSPIPGELQKETFNRLCDGLEEEDRKKMEKHYVLKKDNYYHLKIFQDVIDKFKTEEEVESTGGNFLDPEKKKEVISDLFKIFRSLGYNTLPVLSSDSMLCYAFEIDDIVYLILDSMARGWHYNTFSEIKKSLYEKKNRHRLHLFSRSDLNGQYEFFKAVSDYVKENGKKLIPFTHQSPFNSNNKLDASGTEYNLKLMLGVDSRKKDNVRIFDKETNRTFLDDILFFNNEKSQQSPYIENIFTSCVHYYEQFTLIPKEGGREYDKINWYITGGGGAELARSFDSYRLSYSRMLYNKRLSSENNEIKSLDSQTRSIEITENRVQADYHFLIVHVKGGEIIEVYPHFVEEEQIHIKPSTLFKNIKYTASTFASPVSFGSMMNCDFFHLGFEKIVPGLYFLTWEPGAGLGVLTMDAFNNINNAAVSTFDFIKFGLNFPRSQYRITLLGSMTIYDRKNVSKDYVSFGIEAPVLYNFFGIGGVGKRLSLGIHYYIPVDVHEGYDPDFGKKIKSSFSIGYTF